MLIMKLPPLCMSDCVSNYCVGWQHGGRKPGYFSCDACHDHSRVNRALATEVGERDRQHYS